MLTKVKRAPVSVPFFVKFTKRKSLPHNTAVTLVIILTLCVAVLPPASAASSNQASRKYLPECLSNLPAEPVNVARVTDGDTIVLSDERRVRLIGMNTLELTEKHPNDRAWALTATTALDKFVRAGSISIISGIETHDRHGRLLAHVTRHDGLNASHKLVSQGLAIAIAVGQNTRCANELQAREHTARQANSGLWSTPGNWRLDQTRLTGVERGFRIVHGNIKQVKGRGKQRSLELENGLIVRLGKHWPTNDESTQQLLDLIVGKRVKVKGWLSGSAGKIYMTLHHPSNLDAVNH